MLRSMPLPLATRPVLLSLRRASMKQTYSRSFMDARHAGFSSSSAVLCNLSWQYPSVIQAWHCETLSALLAVDATTLAAVHGSLWMMQLSPLAD